MFSSPRSRRNRRGRRRRANRTAARRSPPARCQEGRLRRSARSPVPSGAARSSRAAWRSAGSRSGPAPRRRSRGARQRQRLGRGQNRLVGQFQFDPQGLPEGAPPAREVLRRLAVDRVERQEFGPALRLGRRRNGLREGAVGGEAAIAEAEHGHGASRALGRARSSRSRKPLAEAGAVAVAIGRGEHDDPLGAARSGPVRRSTSAPRGRSGRPRSARRAASRRSPRCCRPRCRRAGSSRRAPRAGCPGCAAARAAPRARSARPSPPIAGTPSAMSPSTSPSVAAPCPVCSM